jgi:hypothetical protein
LVNCAALRNARAPPEGHTYRCRSRPTFC